MVHAQELAHKALAEFIKLAGRQHSFAPDSTEYQKRLAAVNTAISNSIEQFLDKVQAAASRTAAAAAAAVEKQQASQLRHCITGRLAP